MKDYAHARTEYAAEHAEHGKVKERIHKGGGVTWLTTTPSYADRFAAAGLSKGHAEPDELVCPITMHLFVDPIVASDGHTYEREAFEAYVKSASPHARSPLTREPLDPAVRVPNHALRKRLRTHLDATLDIARAVLNADALARTLEAAFDAAEPRTQARKRPRA
jgi:hypothetical protein